MARTAPGCNSLFNGFTESYGNGSCRCVAVAVDVNVDGVFLIGRLFGLDR